MVSHTGAWLDRLNAPGRCAEAQMLAGMGTLTVLESVLPLALLRGHYYRLGTDLSVNDALVVLVGLLVGVCTVLYIRLIALAGAVFGSQSAYAITVAGIAWSVVLLGEVLTGWTIVALIMVVSGLALVGPKREAGNIEVEFRRRGRARGGRHARA